MTVDSQGNLYVAAGLNIPRGSDETLDNRTGIYVISPAGKLLRMIPIPEDLVTNVAFSGPDLKTLYVTSGKTLSAPGWTSPVRGGSAAVRQNTTVTSFEQPPPPVSQTW